MSIPYHVYTRNEWGAEAPRPRTRQDAPTEAFVHHTENGDAAHIQTVRQALAAVRAIQHFHMHERVPPFSDIGYHFMVFQPGGAFPHALPVACRPIAYVPAAQLEHNTRTLAIAVYGDGRRDPMHPNTRFVIEALVRTYGPNVRKIGGHRDVVQTECPGDRFYAAVPRIADALNIAHF